ncbi:MAG: DUF2938 family protein [Rhodospirillaceae bacterium]|nr:DUF2938 family protein [Rhodospirillaceae bacterium]
MISLSDILIIAVSANIVTDLYEFALERLLGKTRDWHLVGRWVANIFRGSVILDTNHDALAVPGELILGWVFHYIVAFLYVAMYLVGTQFILGEPPAMDTAIGFGIITVAAPWLILMPGLGLGVFAAKAAKPNFVRAASLSVHTVFGIGIYLGLVILGQA